MSKYADLIAVVEATKVDAEKFFEKGNNSAGTRLRKSLQDIKKLAQEIRKDVSESRKSKVSE